MIFVTVGTHEQQFNRLIQKMDELIRDGVIQEEVIMQTGYSTYDPKYCKFFHMIPFDEMSTYISQARIIIAHGGPASFISALQERKIPIVVPRKADFGEHVNNHQVEFCRFIEKRLKNIIVVEDIDWLSETIQNYNHYCDRLNDSISTHNDEFNQELEKIIDQVMKK